MATRIFFLFILLFFFGQTFSYGAENQKFSVKEIYELQEKCANNSAQFFEKIYGSGQEEAGFAQEYECHYNRKLNKCFIKIHFLSRGNDNKLKLTMIELYDVLENNQFGLFTDTDGINCHFQGMECKSLREWVTLITPYMTE